jgi:hypothetical protein
MAGCSFGPARSPSTLEPPLIFVRQLGEYPMPDEYTRYQTGHLVALWPDGRILRTRSLLTLQRRYYEGYVPAPELEEFLSFLAASGLAKRPEGGTIVIHNAQRQITLRVDGKPVTFLESLPEPRDSLLQEVTERLLRLPVTRRRSVRWVEEYPSRWMPPGPEESILR